MALPRLAGSPGAAAALPCPGPEGLAPFHLPALPFSSCPHPLPGWLAGRNGELGTQLRRRGGSRLLCDVSSLRGYLYPHDWISFMKPGPGVSVRRGAGAKVPRLYADLGGPGLGSGPPGVNVRRAWETPALLASGREGRSRATCAPCPLFPTPHSFLCNCWPFVPSSGNVSWATNRLGSMAFFALGADRPRTLREEGHWLLFQNRAQLLTKGCVSPVSSCPGRLHVLAGSPLWVTFLCDLAHGVPGA